MTGSLSGRRALVTGSVRGLGLEIGRALAAAGARVVLNGRDTATLQEAVDELRADGLEVEPAAFDVTDLDAAAEALDRVGELHILVNNVGHRDRRGLDELLPDDLARMLQVHVTAAYALCRRVAADWAARGVAGRIVNISSVMGELGRPGDVAYPVAKAGLDGLTRALAVELGPTGTPSPPTSTPRWSTTRSGPSGCGGAPRSAAGVSRRRSPGSWSSSPGTGRRS